MYNYLATSLVLIVKFFIWKNNDHEFVDKFLFRRELFGLINKKAITSGYSLIRLPIFCKRTYTPEKRTLIFLICDKAYFIYVIFQQYDFCHVMFGFSGRKVVGENSKNPSLTGRQRENARFRAKRRCFAFSG